MPDIQPIQPLPPATAQQPQGGDTGTYNAILNKVLRGAVSLTPGIPLAEQPSSEAVLNYATTGQWPRQIKIPSGGPVGDALQAIGLRAKYRQPLESERLLAEIARRDYLTMPDKERLDKAKTIMQWTEQMGGASGRAAAPMIEGTQPLQLEKAIDPSQVGIGTMKAAELTAKTAAEQAKAAASQAASEAREHEAAAREAAAQGKLDQMLLHEKLQRDKEDFVEEQKLAQPTYQAAYNLQKSLNDWFGGTVKAKAAAMANPLADPAKIKGFDDMITDIRQRTIDLANAIAGGPEAIKAYLKEAGKVSELGKKYPGLGLGGTYTPLPGGFFGGPRGGEGTEMAPGGPTGP